MTIPQNAKIIKTQFYDPPKNIQSQQEIWGLAYLVLGSKTLGNNVLELHLVYVGKP